MTIKACECGEACGEVDFGGLMYVAIKGGDPLLAQLGVNDVVAPPVWLLVLLTRDGNDYVMHALPRAAAATQVGLAAIVAKFPRRMNVYVQREVGGHTFPLVWD